MPVDSQAQEATILVNNSIFVRSFKPSPPITLPENGGLSYYFLWHSNELKMKPERFATELARLDCGEILDIFVENEDGMTSFANSLATKFEASDWVLLEGPLGAGKTTFARAVIHYFGWTQAVRSPTFNLVHLFPTTPLIAHADLYRTPESVGTDILELFDDRLCLIEWPEPLFEIASRFTHWRLKFMIAEHGRIVNVHHYQPK